LGSSAKRRSSLPASFTREGETRPVKGSRGSEKIALVKTVHIFGIGLAALGTGEGKANEVNRRAAVCGGCEELRGEGAGQGRELEGGSQEQVAVVRSRTEQVIGRLEKAEAL